MADPTLNALQGTAKVAPFFIDWLVAPGQVTGVLTTSELRCC